MRSMPRPSRLLKVVTPTLEDEAATNEQNLTVKEVVARHDPARFRATMFFEQPPDPRIAGRPNTLLRPWRERGNTRRTFLRLLTDVPDISFFPPPRLLDDSFFGLPPWLAWHTSVLTYHVSR